jgi:hypothetical protein
MMRQLMRARTARVAALLAATAISGGALAGPMATPAAAKPTFTPVYNVAGDITLFVPTGAATQICNHSPAVACG